MRDLSSRFLTFRTLHVGFKIFTGRQADAFAVQTNGIKPILQLCVSSASGRRIGFQFKQKCHGAITAATAHFGAGL